MNREQSNSRPDVPVIAIDGPSASGKGTVAQRVADELGFHYLDSGALYRLVALAAEKARLTKADELGLMARALPAEFHGAEIFLSGENVTRPIRTEEISAAASRIAQIAQVREGLMVRQRAFRQAPGLVADGRDMGSAVFPDAGLKVFLTASADERALRRYKQLKEKGLNANLDALLEGILERDRRDAGRALAPLQQCADAHVLDTTSLSIDESVQEVIRWFGGTSHPVPSH
jgi:cytidylate kinase